MTETETRVEALTSVAESLSDLPGDVHPVIEVDEELIPEGVAMTADDEAIIINDMIWEATHYIGDYIVQQRTFVNGLAYWIERDGKRRRPTKDNPLRSFAPKPAAAQQMFLDRTAFAITMAAMFNEELDRAEDSYGNVAEKIDDSHIRLSLYDRVENSHARYLIQIPNEFEVAGIRL